MTYSSDRLDRIEALLERSIAQHSLEMTEIRAGLRETRAITESNARSIQAYDARIEEGIAEAEEVSSAMSANTNTRMEEAITDTVELIANLGQQTEALERTFETYLQDARADRQKAEQNKAEADQRFNNLLEEARADRQKAERDRALNENEHRAFRETFQTLLAEIARLWQRVAG